MTIGQIKRLIDLGQSGPDRADWKKQSLVKWLHKMNLLHQKLWLPLGFCPLHLSKHLLL